MRKTLAWRAEKLADERFEKLLGKLRKAKNPDATSIADARDEISYAVRELCTEGLNTGFSAAISEIRGRSGNGMAQPAGIDKSLAQERIARDLDAVSAGALNLILEEADPDSIMVSDAALRIRVAMAGVYTSAVEEGRGDLRSVLRVTGCSIT